MSDKENEIFEKPKTKKVKKELSPERKQALREQLIKARAVAKEKREANKKKVDEMAKSEQPPKEESPKVDVTMTETEGDIKKTIAPPSPTPETTDDDINIDEILNIQMDIEEARAKKKEKREANKKKAKGIFANKQNKQKELNIDEIVERKLNERLSKLNNKTESKPQEKPKVEKKVSIQEPPKISNVVKPEAPKPKPKPISSFSRPWWSN
jgi:hypothetical protein